MGNITTLNKSARALREIAFMASYRITIKTGRLKVQDRTRNSLVRALRGAPFTDLEQVSRKPQVWQLRTIAGREEVGDKLRKLDAVESVHVKHGAAGRDIEPEGSANEEEWQDVAEEPVRPMLLSIPAEIRNRIYRMVLVKGDWTRVKVNAPPPKDPALLQTCRQIRAKSIELYYKENDFLFHIAKFDASKYIAWRKLSKYRKKHGVFFWISSSRNWSNLLQWLKAWWYSEADCVKPADDASESGRRADAIATRLFSMVARMETIPDMKWAQVESMLEDVHEVLKLEDSRWS